MENKIIAVIVDQNEEICKILSEALTAEKDFRVAGCVGDGKAALELVRKVNPDIIIMDFILSSLDGIGVLERLGEIPGKRPEVLITSAVARQSMVDTALGLGAAYFLKKPYEVQQVVNRARQILRPKLELFAANASPAAEQSVESRVTEIIHEIGIPAHIKGYQYLREAIMLTVNDMDMINLNHQHGGRKRKTP